MMPTVSLVVELLAQLQLAGFDAALPVLDVGGVVAEHGGVDKWAQGNFFAGFLDAVKRVASVAAIAMLVGIPLYLALYWWSQRHTVPVVVLLLMGSSVMPMLPANVARYLWIMILLGGGLSLFAIIWLVIR